MPSLLAVAMVLAASAQDGSKPYEDIKSRFRIELPEGWKWNPQPGDTLGTWFRKQDTGALGNFAVRVVKLDRTTTLDNLLKEAEGAISDEPGYRRLSDKQVTVASRATTKREYTMFVAGSDRTQRRVEDYFLQNGDHAFWLHFETLAEGFDLFREDVDQMVASFVPIAGGQKAALVGESAMKLIGRWQKIGDAELVMELKEDGTYVLGAATGSYTVEKNALILRISGQGEERFNYSLNKDELTVAGPNLDVPIHYRKIGIKRTAKLAGTWKPRSAKVSSLRLSPGGQFVFGEVTGNYKQKGDLLVMRRVDGAEVIYSLWLEVDLMKLSGGDMAGETIFDREK
ncbi:MAG: hypothetical protein IT381_12660 [Deltaproteobacteria bacterium]|nr:hypothetical protein [Deltaproteobacteria bacterium]